MSNPNTISLEQLVSDRVEQYNTYYNRKRTPSELFVIREAILRICNVFYNGKPPHLYVMYLAADAAFSILTNKNKFESILIKELEEELIKDIYIFNKLV